MTETKKKDLPYLADKAEVEPQIRGVLPDPHEVPNMELKLNVDRPVDRNYMGEILDHPEPEAIVFVKIYVLNEVGRPIGITWRQRGFDPLTLPENRKKFVQETFGISEEEIKRIIG